MLARRHARQASWPPRIGGVAAWIGVCLLGVLKARDAIASYEAGFDLWPVRNAGLALRASRPIYDVRAFVYPPPAALVGLAESYLSLHSAITAYSYFEVVAIGATLLVFRGCLTRSRWSLLLSGIVACVLLGGDLVSQSLFLDNASLLLLLPLVFIVVAWAKGRWRGGAVVLAVTLLVKPILLPLLLIPLLYREWRAFALCVGITAVGIVASLPLAGDPSRLPAVALSLARGSVLVGREAVFNLSLSGIAHVDKLGGVFVVALQAVLVVLSLALCARVAAERSAPSLVIVASTSGLLLATEFLAGPLSENHYLFLLLPAACVAFHSPSRLVRALIVVGFISIAYSASYFHGDWGSQEAFQFRFVLFELLVFAATARVLASGVGEIIRGGDRSTGREVVTEGLSIDQLRRTPVSSMR